jgi:hypothetical protein
LGGEITYSLNLLLKNLFPNILRLSKVITLDPWTLLLATPTYRDMWERPGVPGAMPQALRERISEDTADSGG